MGRAADREPLASRARRSLRTRLGIDQRALAALRVSTGLLLLADLWLRSRDLVAHYTDAGVLPRAALREQLGALAALSVHALSGSAWFEGLLFVVAGLLAAALVLGYRTRLATGLSLLLLASLHVRNPLVLNAGDALLRRLLLWGLFLPLGARWSLDARRRAPAGAPPGPATGDEGGADSAPAAVDGAAGEPASVDEAAPPGGSPSDGRAGWVASLASAALLLQVVVVYLTNAVIKLRADVWPSGAAMEYVFGLDHLTVGLGDALAAYPSLLRPLGQLWLGLLVASWLLVVLTGWPRAALAGLFAAGHVGMLLTLRLGLFPLVSIAALLVFLPRPVWDGVERTAQRVAGGRPVGHRLADRRLVGRRPEGPPIVDRLARGRPTGSAEARSRPLARWRHSPLARWPRNPRAGWRRAAGTGLVVVLVVSLTGWNAAALGVVPVADTDAVVDPAESRWDMFAPVPRTDDGWYVAPGRLATGERVDALRGGPVRWDRPPELAATFPSHRWFLYLLDVKAPSNADLQPALGAYLCARWNGEHDTALRNVTVYFVREPVRLDGPPETRRIEVTARACSAGGARR